MKSKVVFLKAMFFAPLFVAALRIVLTVVIFIWNPQSMPLRFVQLIPVIILLVYSFMYFKLYNDGDPVVTLLLPTILHFALVWVLEKQMVWVPFIVPVVVDILYLVVKGIKGASFPFEIEGEDELDALDAFEDSELEDTRVLG